MHHGESFVGSEIDVLACRQCRVPIEGGRDYAVGLVVVCECPVFRVQHRESVVGGNPDVAVLSFRNAFHTVVCQTVLRGVSLKLQFSVGVGSGAVDAVAVAAYPHASVARLAKARYLVHHLRFRLVELVHQVVTEERIAFLVAFCEVDNAQSCLASHPELSAAVNQCADAASCVKTAFERQNELALVEIVEEHSVVASYPQSVVALVVYQCTYVVEQFLVFLIHLEVVNL